MPALLPRVVQNQATAETTLDNLTEWQRNKNYPVMVNAPVSATTAMACGGQGKKTVSPVVSPPDHPPKGTPGEAAHPGQVEGGEQ